MNEALLAEISRLLAQKRGKRLILSIDGRCASGKTTLAAELQKQFDCTILHMDDFFLRPEQRSMGRYAEPGGNVDRERFCEEVLEPLLQGKPFSYRAYDCRSGSFKRPVTVKPTQVTVIEGSYSCHPELWDSADLHVFMTTTPQKQEQRLAMRVPGDLERYRTQWIPMEERYLSAFPIEKNCELRIET